jgi:membrane fusion protein, adhesin transport system
MLNLSRRRVNDEVLEKYNLHALGTLYNPRTARLFALWLRYLIIILLIILFLPWQQNISGTGTVTALLPEGRPQTIQNIIPGRIEQWYVREGDLVKPGDTLLRISEIKDDYLDPNLDIRIQEQIASKLEGIGGYESKIQALDQQKQALREGLSNSLLKSKNKVEQARQKVISDSTDLLAAQRNYEISKDRLARYEDGFKNGLFSLTDLESRRLKAQEELAKLVAQQSKVQIARQELANAVIELRSVEWDYREKLAKATSDLSSAQASLADAAGELSKLKNKYTSVEVRQNNYIVRAPQEGYIVKVLKAGLGENIKEGETIATLQPTHSQLAVELYINPMDVTLVSPGREVRLEFDGWPALQFGGWPGVSVGTFGGKVSVIDRVNSANGKFRLMVVPTEEEQWPQAIRLGSGVYGWVMLSDVPIWYEIWRQLNGFPPNLNQNEIDKITTPSTGSPKKK